jgi:hypothetical protein
MMMIILMLVVVVVVVVGTIIRRGMDLDQGGRCWYGMRIVWVHGGTNRDIWRWIVVHSILLLNFFFFFFVRNARIQPHAFVDSTGIE